MKIEGMVHCLFEQSGTFKKAFKALNIAAEDYDIKNDFGETDHIIDIFHEIEKAYEHKESIFDRFSGEDLILAFFPCIYFCGYNTLASRWNHANYRKLTIRERTEKVLERSKNRDFFYSVAVKMVTVAETRGLRLIMENPVGGGGSFLEKYFVKSPSVIDTDRSQRGDLFVKPTGYWFFGCEPESKGKSWSVTLKKNIKKIQNARSSVSAGECSTERSMISSEYAKNFIGDIILGIPQSDNVEQTLF